MSKDQQQSFAEETGELIAVNKMFSLWTLDCRGYLIGHLGLRGDSGLQSAWLADKNRY